MGAEDLRVREAEQRDDRLRFAVLGPVRVSRGDQALNMGSPQQRALLAALLLHGGRTATAVELIDALWGEEPPSQALAVLRTYASRIRKSLRPDTDLLVSESGGYALRLGAEAVLDLDTAQKLVAHAEKATDSGELARARALYTDALAEWDGEPLAHIAGPFAAAHRIRLEEWRLGLLERRLDLDLRTGLHAKAVSELTALTSAHPLRERLRELLMLALYRSGRQAEALAVYADTRRLLADELGVDPRPELSELQQRILEADEELAHRTDATADASAVAVTRPAQLPATVADFTGRAPFVDELSHQLAEEDGTVMAVSSVAGIGGVGKTTTAVHVAHRAAPHFPDGQLWADLQGTGLSPAEPRAVLGLFLSSLGVPDSAIPDSFEARVARYRSLLDGRRVLVFLDNARDAAQVRPLLPGTAGCAALVTSRVRMVDLAGARLVDLDVMSPDEAMTLFTRIVGEERVAEEREAAMDVVAACGFLPLAIRIAASRLAARRTWSVSVLAAKLADERRRLDELQAGDQAVKATFELGYQQLDPEQARAFRLLSLPDGPDISLSAASAALDRAPEDAEDLLESLIDVSLLESAAPARYRFHDMVRLYARACAERDEPGAERQAVHTRLLGFSLATAARAYGLERPGVRVPVRTVEAFRGRALDFAGHEDARDWLFIEGSSLISAALQGARLGLLREGVDLLVLSQDLAESGAAFQHYRSALTTLRDAAAAAGDERAEARSRTLLARTHLLLGDYSAAEAEARAAVRLSGPDSDAWCLGNALTTRGAVAIHAHSYAEGASDMRTAAEVFRAGGDEAAAAGAFSGLARIHAATGQPDRAVELAEESVGICDRLGHERRGADARYALGQVLDAAGSHGRALEAFTEALAVFQGARQRFWESLACLRIAEVHLARHRGREAASMAERALVHLPGIGGDWRRANALALLGRALAETGQPGRAAACWREALELYEALESPEAGPLRELLYEGGRALTPA